MRTKERWRAIFDFKPTDRPWRFETLGLWKETYASWHGQGLPRWVDRDPRAFAYFGYDRWIPVVIGDHLQPGYFPKFKRRLISSHGDHEIWQNEAGGREKVFTNDRSSIPQAIKAPVEGMDDLRRLQPRLDPDAPGRLQAGRLDTLLDRVSIRYTQIFNYPLGMLFSGLFGFSRHLLGLERYMMSIYDDPELLHQIGRIWEKLVTGVAKRMVAYKPVWAGFWEDMCFKTGMFISADHYRKFITPYFKRALDQLYDVGIEQTWVDSDGNVTQLIPLIEEVGIKGMMPFEVQAGMDILEVRRNHPRLTIIGGLDKRILAQGRDVMEAEIQAKAVPLLKARGYIPGLDHAVPPDVSLEDFRWFLGRMRSREMVGYCR